MREIAWAWLDGRLVAAGEPQLRLSDRGFQLGDGVFETLRARRGVAIELAGHMARLHQSAAALELDLPIDDDALARAIRALLRADDMDADGLDADVMAAGGIDGGLVGDAALRITISRGPSPGRGLMPPPGDAGAGATRPTVAIQAWPYAPPAERLLREGLTAVTSALRRDAASPLAGIKSTSRADHVLAALEARRAGVDDAIHLTLDGRLAESTTANLWIVRRGELLTPPLTAGILAGTTRDWLLGQGRLAGRRAREVDLWPADLLAAEEAFLSASVSGIVPLVRLDGRPIGHGRPGPVTLALRESRERWIDEFARSGVGATAPSDGAASPTPDDA